MSLAEQINEDIKTAMRAKDRTALEALRAIKSAILLAQTEEGASGDLAEEAEIKLLQKLHKQRKDAADIYQQQDREDLAEAEQAQAEVIARYLPEQMGEEELKKILSEIITQVGATSPADMGKVMGVASKQLAGKADGKTIAATVKQLLA